MLIRKRCRENNTENKKIIFQGSSCGHWIEYTQMLPKVLERN